MASTPARRGLLVGLCALLALGASCDLEDAYIDRLEGPWGIVEGYVSGGGEPLNGRIYLYQRKSGDGFYAETDSLGWYSIAVPVGTYELSLRGPMMSACYYSGSGPTADRDRSGPVEVGGERVRADFEGGVLEVRLDLPPSWEGESARCAVGYVDNGRFRDYDRESGEVQGGSAALTMPFVCPEDCLLKVEVGSRSFYYPGTPYLAQATVFSLASGERRTVQTCVDPPAVIEGAITGSWQTLTNIGLPTIEAYDADSVLLGQCRASRQDGSFRLEVFGQAAVRLRAGIERVGRWYGGGSLSQAEVFELSSGVQYQDVTWIESALECRVELDRVPVRSAALSLVDGAGRTVATNFSCPDGYAVIPNLGPGTYFLHARSGYSVQTWLAQWYDGGDSLAAATPIQLSQGGEIASVTMRVHEGGAILGRIIWLGRDESIYYAEKPLELLLYPLGEDAALEYRPVLEGDAGEYGFFGLPDGDYRVAVRWLGGYFWWYPGTPDRESASTLSIRGHARLTEVDWTSPYRRPDGNGN